MSNICSKSNRKFSALTRDAKFPPFKKKPILFNAFVESQFKCSYGCFTEGKLMIRQEDSLTAVNLCDWISEIRGLVSIKVNVFIQKNM